MLFRSTDAGTHHAEDLAGRGAGEVVVSDGDLAAGEGGALGGLHVWPQPIPGKDLRHFRQVRVQGVDVDDRRRGRQLGDNSWVFHRADGETRTLTDGVLSAVPLPLGYVGRTDSRVVESSRTQTEWRP